MKVPFLDLKAGYLEIKEELDEAYNRATSSGRDTNLDKNDSNENAFSESRRR